MNSLKPYVAWVVSSPNRAFVVTFAALTCLVPGMASLLFGFPGVGYWIASLRVITGIAGFVAAGVMVRIRSPRLSWQQSFWIATQVVVGFFACVAPVAFGLPHSAAPGALALSVVWGMIAIAAAWGIVLDSWWGYVAESVVLGLMVAVLALTPGDKPAHRHPISELPWLESLFGGLQVIVVIWVMWRLLKHGRSRWLASR